MFNYLIDDAGALVGPVEFSLLRASGCNCRLMPCNWHMNYRRLSRAARGQCLMAFRGN